MPDERIKERFGISRQTAEQSCNKAITKFGAGKPLKERESQVLKVFGLSKMWQFVFDDKTLLSDFVELLIAEGALAEESRSSFESVSSFISLRSEEHTSELQSLMRISYAVFCLKKKKQRTKK